MAFQSITIAVSPAQRPRVADPLRLGDHTATPGLLATAADLFRLTFSEVHPGLALIQCLVERPRDVLVEVRLVLLDRELVMATPVDDLGGDVFLTTHGVDGHHRPR